MLPTSCSMPTGLPRVGAGVTGGCWAGLEKQLSGGDRRVAALVLEQRPNDVLAGAEPAGVPAEPVGRDVACADQAAVDEEADAGHAMAGVRPGEERHEVADGVRGAPDR